MIMEIQPAWIGIGITVAGAIFTAGGWMAGTMKASKDNVASHRKLDEKSSHIDRVKQSVSVCDERHRTYDAKLDGIGDTVGKIERSVEWLVRRENNGRNVEGK